jgi:hypothetical protein
MDSLVHLAGQDTVAGNCREEYQINDQLVHKILKGIIEGPRPENLRPVHCLLLLEDERCPVVFGGFLLQAQA